MTATAMTPSPAAFDADAFLRAERGRVNAALEAVAAQVAQGAPPALRDAMRYALATPGKRLRPILCIAAYRVLHPGAPAEAVYRLACAVEVVHTYSLVHDDLPCMDDDDLRRGRPTVHVVFGHGAALLAGAALVPAAVRVLDGAAGELGLDAPARGRLVAELCRAGGAQGMVAGQWLDLQGEQDGARMDADGLERIHRHKTGALLAVSLRLGALAAGADEPRVEALTAYGRELGLAFQIVDDVLDVTRTDAELGKTAGKDADAGKATYPSLFGLERARQMARERMRRAVDALHAAGIHSPELEALAAYVVERGR